MSKDDVRILDAEVGDIDTLVAICCAALEEDVITRFMFGARREEAVKVQAGFFKPVLHQWLTHPPRRCRIIKVVVGQENRIIGWSFARWQDGTPSPNVWKETPGQPKFLEYYWKEQNRNWTALTDGKKHVVLGSLYVDPEMQRRGIGTKMLEHMFEHAGLAEELVFVQTMVRSQRFYEQFGWQVHSSTDIDLAEWGGAGCGFGLHKAPQMLRRPGALKRSS